TRYQSLRVSPISLGDLLCAGQGPLSPGQLQIRGRERFMDDWHIFREFRGFAVKSKLSGPSGVSLQVLLTILAGRRRVEAVQTGQPGGQYQPASGVDGLQSWTVEIAAEPKLGGKIHRSEGEGGH